MELPKMHEAFLLENHLALEFSNQQIAFLAVVQVLKFLLEKSGM